MKLFDLHCDTATVLLKRGEGLYNNSLHVSLKKAEYLDSYAQVMAIWTDYKLTDSEGYLKFFEVADNLEKLDEDIKPSGRHLVFRNPPHGVKGQENACQKEEDALRKGLFEGHRKDGL
jgi:hypothetical protein